MKIERRKNASRNIVSGVSLKLFQTLVPFALRTAMIYKLGMEYVGLDSLFVSILQVLNLAELGVGHAMVYSMYKPIAEDNSQKLKALLNLYKLYYRIIGFIVLATGIVLIPILPHLISCDTPSYINIYVLYIINLLATVASYWLFAYKSSLLMAYQRNDIFNKIQIVTFSIRYILQFIAILLCRNYYLYAMAVLISQLLTNVMTYIVVNKKFPNCKPKGSLSPIEKKEINCHIKDLFTAKLGGTVTNSADIVVISAFLGLNVLAIYTNYYYILSALFGFLTIIFQSCLAGIGNSLVVEDTEKNFRDFKTFSFVLSWIIGFCTVALYCLFQPFMEFWVHAGNMLDDSFIPLFCLYFYVYELALVWATYKDAGGIWHDDRFRPLCVTIVNLGLNLLTIKFLGLYGVLASTVISYVFVGMPWMLHNIFKKLFIVKPNSYLYDVFIQIVVTGISCIIVEFICKYINLGGFIGLTLRGFTVLVLTNMIFYLCYFRMPLFADVKNIVLGMLRTQLRRGNRE